MAQKVVKTEKRETETVFYVEERETIELFSFDELPENVQNTIDENWFEYLKDDFHQTLELIGFFNINSRFEKKGISFTAEWDAKRIANNPKKWESQQAYDYFSPFMRIMGRLGGKAKIAERCYITADSVLDELVLEEMYNNICNIYHSKL